MKGFDVRECVAIEFEEFLVEFFPSLEFWLYVKETYHSPASS